MKQNKLLRAVRLSAIAAATVTVSLAATSSHAADIPNKTLVYCSEGSPAGFDPAQYTTGTDFTANTFTVYNRLVEFKRGSTEIEPGLAESWDVSSDGKVYTFHLRHGVKFQTAEYFKPTREFNADDVVFTFERMLDTNEPFRKAYPVQFPYFTDMGLDKLITKIDKIDLYTVRFTLKEVNAPFLQNMAMEFASILSKEYADQLLKEGKAADINQKPLGTGPFIFKSYTKDATIRFTGNPDYWKPGAVKLKNLIFSITTDASVRAQKLKRNECQVMSYPKPADIADLKKDPDISMPSQAGFNLGYLSYNVTHKPLDNVDVRRALDMAVNKKAIVESVYQGAGQPAKAPMPPTQWSYDGNLPMAAYDTAKAKALLAKAGFPNGFEITLWAMPVQRPYNPNAKLMAEMIQSDWAKIGVKAKIVTYEWGEYIKRAHAGEDDTMLIGWNGDNGDPDNWLGTLLGCEAVHGNNFSEWCYKPFDEQIQKGRTTNGQDARTKIYMQAQQIFAEQLPFSPIAHSTLYQPTTKNVVDMRIDPLGYARFDGVSLK
ncbi:ABC transporter substrate-binding protein [Trinickia diaoshuihuensis]|uniref:ABC transporter substrate-binding protein n=1 Tax=Trinickia diaoshuihuensis TaxID=2292265 RepID=UPI000E224E7B|nr:ABC transporter substrate-binding protein [Trinickia diaoshuihuensis]